MDRSDVLALAARVRVGALDAAADEGAAMMKGDRSGLPGCAAGSAGPFAIGYGLASQTPAEQATIDDRRRAPPEFQ